MNPGLRKVAGRALGRAVARAWDGFWWGAGLVALLLLTKIVNQVAPWVAW